MANTPHLNASSRIMYEEAQQLGITCTVFDDHETILMEKNGHRWFTRGSRTSLQSSVGKTIADVKSLTKTVLHHFSLPTAKSVTLHELSDLAQLSALNYPVVMKALQGRHGKDVYLGINSAEEAAQKFAEVGHQSMLVEETLVGTEYRIVCVDYVFLAAAFRKPAHVVGDGQQTVQALIKAKNAHPWRGRGHEANLTLIEVDDMVHDNLREQNLTLDSVPDSGREVWLRKTANLSTGGEAWDVTDEVCEENRQLFAQIAKACDLNVAGIDIMCQTLKTPIVDQTRAGVIEVNASPGLRMHHFPIKGQSRNIAHVILQMVLHTLNTTHG